MKAHTHTFTLGISIKLLLINVAIILVLGIILLTVFFSFRTIDDLITTITQRDVPQILENATSGKDLTSVFADLLTSIFYGQEESKSATIELLETMIHDFTERGTHRELQESLRQFADRLNTLLEHSSRISEISQSFRTIEDDFTFELTILDDIVRERIAELAEEQRHSPLLRQLEQNSIDEYGIPGNLHEHNFRSDGITEAADARSGARERTR